LAGALPVVGSLFTKARSLYFSSIQNQIVCIDDLERRSKNLELKDVLGLISVRREQRGCKVTLLLNAEKLANNKDEFEGFLEKVVDAKVVLAPTPAECAVIAVPGQDGISVPNRRLSAAQARCPAFTGLLDRFGKDYIIRHARRPAVPPIAARKRT
jgi:hypothetical protein